MPFVAVSYRNDSEGKGAFFDHFTLRKMTGWSTQIVVKPGTPIIALTNYMNYRAGYNYYGLPINNEVPLAEMDGANAAFIFLPGYSRDSDTNQPDFHKNRLNFEKELIRKARNRGQPVLGVCAGSWTLWQAYGGSLKDVADHNYGGAMPRLSTSSAAICNNKMLHRVRPIENTFLSAALKYKPGVSPNIQVNSVHWKAVNPDTLIPGSNLMISALSVEDQTLAPKSRNGDIMHPDNCVEAFETINGVPMVGVQWHPEAFNPDEPLAMTHQGLFKAIQAAGATYINRRNLNNQFNQHWREFAVSEFSFFKTKNIVTSNDEDLVNDLSELKLE